MSYRIGIAGLLHESNTFLPVPTTYEDFASTTLTTGEALVNRWSGKPHELGGFLDAARISGLTPVPLMATFAVPSGTITAAAFDRLKAELLDAVSQAGRLDGLLIALHGATVAENYRDADGEILRRLREFFGPGFPIVCTLDLHANVSHLMAKHATALIAYRSNPHLDQKERGQESAALIAQILRGEVQPVQALETPPLVIPISKQNTAEPPVRECYDDLRHVLTWPGILSASVCLGFYYADVEEMGASFIAVSNADPALAQKASRWMAQRAWDRRQCLRPDLMTPADAVRYAAQAARGPVVLMDVGDNVGGGSPGDSTVIFDEVLTQDLHNALVILYDPAAVQQCVAAGVRRRVEIAVGGKTDTRHGRPIPIAGRVRTLHDGCFVEKQVRHGGWSENDQGITAVVETDQQHSVVLTSRRMAPMSLEQLLSLGIRPQDKRLLIVKGVVAPRAAYEPVAAEIILVDSPGVTANDPALFAYKHRRASLFPFEPDARYP